MRTYTYHCETLINAPLDGVFDFFSRAENLEQLTPKSLKFQILTQAPIEMRAGTLIDYRLTLFGVPFHWRTEIKVWEPGRRFIDVQRKGPYRRWVHEHEFEALDQCTFMRDTVQYAVPGYLLSPVIHRLFVRGQVEAIFRFRAKAIQQLFS